MIELKRLNEIFNKLSNEELIVIRKNILYNGSKSDSLQATKKIFDIIISNPESVASQISNIYYGKINLVALKKLLQRLTDKILEILSNKELLLKNKLYDTKGKIVFNLRKKLLYYDILAAHGITNYALMILNQVIVAAKTIEYYDYLILALEKKLIKMSLANGEISFRKVYADIMHYSECNYALKNCNYLLRLYSASFEYRKKHFSNEKLLSAINNIKNDYKKTNSKSIKINIYYLEGIYYFNNGLYLKCKNNFKLCYSYLTRNSFVVYNSYLINCLINISEMDTMLWKFQNSLTCLEKIISEFSRNEFNEKLLREMIFLNYFYMGDLKNALENIMITLNMKLGDHISKFLIAKLNFYLASIYTIQGLFFDSNKILRSCLQLDKDKEGWNIGMRILSIINNIELEKYIYCESQIENLRKHISRVDIDGKLLNRFSIISKIFIHLMNNSFDFKIITKKHKELFESLSDYNSNNNWTLKSPEMLIFHEWFDAKVKGVAYDHVEVMKRLKKNNRRA